MLGGLLQSIGFGCRKGFGRSKPMPAPRKNIPSGSKKNSKRRASSDTGQRPRNAVKRPSASERTSEERKRFTGVVLTAPGELLGGAITDQGRNLCALFDTGEWLVSDSHKNSPHVNAVRDRAEKQNLKINAPTFVSPDVIDQAYAYAQKNAGKGRYEDSALRRQLENILFEAAKLSASDVHLDVSGGKSVVHFGVDGFLRVHLTLTEEEGNRLTTIVYNNSDNPSSSTFNDREPQFGMLSPDSAKNGALRLPEDVTGVRCQWMPLVGDGRYLVMRLHYSGSRILGEDERSMARLGYSDDQIDLLRQSYRMPGGIRFVVGPVNHGKSVSVKVMLNNRLHETDFQKNCIAIEDPPEGEIKGARPVGIREADGDDRDKEFKKIFNATLRTAPDILFLGEVRDYESARFVFKLGLSGRQVYTTMHVYHALAIPQRLLDIGIEPYLVFNHNLVSLLASQRLIRRLCPKCCVSAFEDQKHLPLMIRLLASLKRQSDLVAESSMSFGAMGVADDDVTLPDLTSVYVAGPGCSHCDYTGFTGRTVVAEVIETDAKLMSYLKDNDLDGAKNYWLSGNGLAGETMLMHALTKIRRGELCPAEVELEFGPMLRVKEQKLFESQNEDLIQLLKAKFTSSSKDLEVDDARVA